MNHELMFELIRSGVVGIQTYSAEETIRLMEVLEEEGFRWLERYSFPRDSVLRLRPGGDILGRSNYPESILFWTSGLQPHERAVDFSVFDNCKRYNVRLPAPQPAKKGGGQ